MRLSDIRFSPSGRSGGFTLIELLVVISLFAVLAILQWPALVQAKLRSQDISCLNNMQQLQAACFLYSGDNNDFMPVNSPLSPSYGGDSSSPGIYQGDPCWVDGTFAAGGVGSDNPPGCATNAFYLGVEGTTLNGVTLTGSIGPYVKQAGAYHCPADKSLAPAYEGGGPRVRSCSMNMMVGTTPAPSSAGGAQYGVATQYSANKSYKYFRKLSDFNSKMSASQCFVLLDENPASLNDGWLEYFIAGNGIGDTPAVNHGSSSSFSFADGHVEFHKWADTFLRSPVLYHAGDQDPVWLANHGTYFDILQQ